MPPGLKPMICEALSAVIWVVESAPTWSLVRAAS
jgi:hypothetical protein